MKKITIIIFVVLLASLYAECYELNQADCLYWSAYCEWNDQTGQCQEIGGDEVEVMVMLMVHTNLQLFLNQMDLEMALTIEMV